MIKNYKSAMRKTVAIVLCALMITALTSCKSQNPSATQPKGQPSVDIEENSNVKNSNILYSMKNTNDAWWDQEYGNGFDSSVTRQNVYESNIRSLYELDDASPLPTVKDFAIDLYYNGTSLHTLKAEYNQFLFYNGPSGIEMDVNSAKPVVSMYVCSDKTLSFFPILVSTVLSASDSNNQKDGQEWQITVDVNEKRTLVYMDHELSHGYALRLTFPEIIGEEAIATAGQTQLTNAFDIDTIQELCRECMNTLVVEATFVPEETLDPTAAPASALIEAIATLRGQNDADHITDLIGVLDGDAMFNLNIGAEAIWESTGFDFQCIICNDIGEYGYSNTSEIAEDMIAAGLAKPSSLILAVLDHAGDTVMFSSTTDLDDARAEALANAEFSNMSEQDIIEAALDILKDAEASSQSDSEDEKLAKIESIQIAYFENALEKFFIKKSDPSLQLSVITTPKEASGNYDVEWQSSNPNIIKISDTGIATPVSIGTATITAICGDAKATCEAIVTGP